MRNKLVWHQVALFVVLTVLTVIRFFAVGRIWSAIWLFWWLGSILGFLFVFADRLVYSLFNTEELASIKIKDLLVRGKVIPAVAAALAERETPKKLAMRSVLFVVVWAILAIFTATSVAGGIARGFVLGIGTHLMFDLAWDFFLKHDVAIWFWQVRNVKPNEMRWFVYGSLIYYLFVVWFL